jgi:putative chitinase
MFTKEQLTKMVIYANKSTVDKFYEPLKQALLEFSIDTPKRYSAFIAQITHESGSFRYVKELADGSAYEYRKDLGNLEKEALNAAHKRGFTTGRFYAGRGLIQLTGFYNYKKCGDALGLDLVNYPELLEKTENACRSAAWFWSVNKLNVYADSGNFDKITLIINGGYNGKKERDMFYKVCRKVLSCD